MYRCMLYPFTIIFTSAFGYTDKSSVSQLKLCILGENFQQTTFWSTVDSHYLEIQGTLWNTLRYPYFDIWDLRNWGKQLIQQPPLTEWILNLTPKLEIRILKILLKRGEIAPKDQFLFFSTIFCCLLVDLCVKIGTRFLLRDKRLFEISEITRVDCICFILHGK